MATVTWNNDNATNVWNDADNWDTDSVPTSGDDVIFDATSTDNCTCDVAIDIASLDVQSGYSGILDFGDSAYAHACSGDMTFAGTGTVDCGDSTITCGGHFDYSGQTTWVQGTAIVILTGTSKNLTPKSNSTISELQIDGTINRLTSTTMTVPTLNVNGSFDIAFSVFNTVNVHLASTSTVTGSAAIIINSGSLTRDSGASYTTTNRTELRRSSSLGSGTWGGDFTFLGYGTNTLTFGSDAIFTEDVLFNNNSAGTYTIANDTNDSNLTFQGAVSIANTVGDLTWNAGTGLINTTSTAAQSWNFDGESVEDIEIDKTAGTVTLTGDVNPDSFLLTDGTFDTDGNNLDTIGDFTQAADTTCQNTTGGGLVTVGNDFAINGSSGNECIWDNIDLDITGTAVAHYTTVTGSDASAGTEVTATDNCVDGTGNTNWDFGGGSTLLPIIENVGSSFIGQVGVGGEISSVSDSTSMSQMAKEGKQGQLISILNNLFSVLPGQVGINGNLISILSNSLLNYSGKPGIQGQLQLQNSLSSQLFGEVEGGIPPVIVEGSISTITDSIASTVFGNTGVDGSLLSQIITTASLIGKLGNTGSYTIDLNNISSLIDGILGVSGQVAITISAGADLAGKLGISARLVSSLENLDIQLIEIVQSERIYQIVISTTTGQAIFLTPTTGQAIFLAPKTGTIDINLN